MKKFTLIFIFVLVIVLCGCQAIDINTNNQKDNEQMDTIETFGESEDAENISIVIESLDQIGDIQAIINEENETKAYEALLGLRGAGIKSKEDLSRFLEVINELPILNLVDGEITSISYMKGLAEDTGEEYEFVYITVKANNGNWVRFEYLLNEEESLTTNGTISSTNQGMTVFSKPVDAADGKVKVFSQESKVHASGVGKIFTWNTSIEGTNTRIVYYSQDETQLTATEVFSDVNVVITGNIAS